KQSKDVTRLQALVDKKKVVVTKAAIRDALHLDDAEGVVCLPNEEIFTALARMGYEKPPTKLTFNKAFFSSQWKFLIHTIIQSMSVKRTSWNKFSSMMASAVICLSIDHKFNFSKYTFESLVRNVDSSSKFYMYPRKVGKGCLGVKIPLFEGMLVAGEPQEQGDAEEQGDAKEQGNDDNAAKEPVTAVDDVRDNADDAQVEGRQAKIYQIDMDHAAKVLISAADVVQATVLAATVTSAPVKVVVPSTRRKRGVISDDEEKASDISSSLKKYDVYLKNTAGFRLDYFKGMSYDDIRPIFEAKFNENMEFLLKSKEQIEEEANRAIVSINETPAQKAAKRRRLNKEAKDVEELKQHLEIVPDEDDDIYTEATPLDRKDPVVDYQIVHFNYKPHYKIIRADDTHQLYAKVKSWKLLESCGVYIVELTTISTVEVYIGLDAEYSTAKSGRAE
nr:hypothetical protein [Tanacetum cinerariifolium]